MKTQVLRVDRTRPEPDIIAAAAAVLRRGGLVAFPTETVYGLGANALDATAVAGIFAAKGRPGHNPIIVHVADAAGARRLTTVWPEAAERLTQHFWPGPLTLVLPRQALVPDAVTAGGPTVAVRAPAHPVARALIAAADQPVAAPSANLSARVSATRAEHVLAGLEGRIDLLLDGGPTPGGIESTVLDLSRPRPRLLRPGLVTAAEIEEMIGPIERLGTVAEEGPMPSPGMLARHYAPRAVLECLQAEEAIGHAQALAAKGLRVGLVALGAVADGDNPFLMPVAMPGNATAYARRLYDTLHTLDAAAVDHIVVALPPDTEEWQAIHDRLRRASTRET